MSEGPIKAWRDSWKPPAVSTSPSTPVHATGEGPTLGRAYCGRKVKDTGEWGAVTCADCHADVLLELANQEFP